jgi:hypothetical protein
LPGIIAGMTKAITLVRRHEAAALEAARAAIVCTCAIALIAAGRFLPL